MRKVGFLALLSALTAIMGLFFAARGDAQTGPAPSGLALPGFGSVEIINITNTAPSAPLQVSIERGEVVVWANSTQGFMSVIFSGGATVQRACVAPTNFHLSEKGEYTATNLSPGGTASLCFIEAGRYPFLVLGVQISGPGLGPIRGEVIVK